MSSGGKGGSQTTQVELPEFIQEAGERAVARGEQVGQIGFVPSYGPDVAAFSPTQEAAFAGTNAAAAALGLPTSSGTGLPQAQDFGGGILGYSARPIYDQAIAAFQADRPAQFQAIQDLFIDPYTGVAPQQPAPQSGGLLDSSPSGGNTAVERYR